MSKNPDLPDGWAMPDDLSKKVNKALKRRSITPEQEIQDALDEMARDIALIEPNPVDWGAVCRVSCHLHPAVICMASIQYPSHKRRVFLIL
jgi:hypothetical protein